jgi:hypothetical protein
MKMGGDQDDPSRDVVVLGDGLCECGESAEFSEAVLVFPLLNGTNLISDISDLQTSFVFSRSSLTIKS